MAEQKDPMERLAIAFESIAESLKHLSACVQLNEGGFGGPYLAISMNDSDIRLHLDDDANLDVNVGMPESWFPIKVAQVAPPKKSARTRR